MRCGSVPAEVESRTEASPCPGEDHHPCHRVDRDLVEVACSDSTISDVIAFSESGRFSVSCTTPARGSWRSTSDMAASLLMVLRCDEIAAGTVARMPAVALPTPVPAPSPFDTPFTSIAATLAPFRHGRIDPTTVLRSVGRGRTESGTFLHATLTPDGPGTVRVRWKGPRPNRQRWEIDAYGSGGEWLAGRIPRMLGSDDAGMAGVDTAGWSPTVTTALQASRHVSIGASSNLYHELLPTIVEQRITGFEAHRQWRRLCVELGDPAPGPVPRSPPAAGAGSPPGPTRLVVPPARHRAQAGRRPSSRSRDIPPASGNGPTWRRAPRPPNCGCCPAWAPGPWGRCWRRRWAIPTRSPSATIT